MTEPLTTSRASRNRRLLAVTIWGVLLLVAGFLWNGRQLGHIRSVAAEPVAFLLAAFTAFVSVFAWMLFNPNRRAAAESPALFLAGAVTLLPPCIIGFCLLPADSMLRGWLAFGLLALIVIAVLSPVPEEFFAVPRARSTYFRPAPELEIPDAWISVTETNWLQDPHVASVVSSGPRPSLAPSAYRDRSSDAPAVSRPSRAERITERRRERAERRQIEAEALTEQPGLRGLPPTRPDVAKPEPRLSAPQLGFRTEPSPATARVEHEAHDELNAPEFERFKDKSGSELIEGSMVVRFERGQKRANLHVPFSPPLPGTPEVECETVGDVSLRLKVPVRQSYGLRIEARRSNAEEALETQIGFSAIYSPQSQVG